MTTASVIHRTALLYVSTDSGTTWSVRPACQCRRIGTLVIDPSDSSRVWICGDAGLERSDDAGMTWTLLRGDTVTDIVFQPGSTSTIFIAVLGAGYFKSTDYGATFSPLPGAPTGAGVAFPRIAIGVSGAQGRTSSLSAAPARSRPASTAGRRSPRSRASMVRATTVGLTWWPAPPMTRASCSRVGDPCASDRVDVPTLPRCGERFSSDLFASRWY